MMVHYLYVFFFFKQKTAYEMRISDWSSDVCSSDLINRGEYRADDGAIEVDNPITPKPPRPSNPGKGRLKVDGMWGTSTTRRLQKVLGTSQDGTVSSQNSDWRASNPGLTHGWQWVGNPRGSPVIAALQDVLGVENPATLGPARTRPPQRRPGT